MYLVAFMVPFDKEKFLILVKSDFLSHRICAFYILFKKSFSLPWATNVFFCISFWKIYSLDCSLSGLYLPGTDSYEWCELRFSFLFSHVGNLLS